MTTAALSTQASIASTVAAIAQTPEGWALEQYRLEGEVARQWLFTRLQFTDFMQAWAFASKVALLAEKRKHHPDMTVGYNYVELYLTTHAAGQTLKPVDFKLAAEITELPEMQEKLRAEFQSERQRKQVEEVLGHPVPDYVPMGAEAGRISRMGNDW